MEVVPRDGEAVHFGAGYLNAFLVRGIVDFAGDDESNRNCGSAPGDWQGVGGESPLR
jgi:hypothetical protein